MQPGDWEDQPAVSAVKSLFGTGRYHASVGGYFDARFWKGPDQRQRSLVGHRYVSREPSNLEPPRESGLLLLNDGTFRRKTEQGQIEVSLEEVCKILELPAQDIQDWVQKVIVRRRNLQGGAIRAENRPSGGHGGGHGHGGRGGPGGGHRHDRRRDRDRQRSRH